MAVHNTLDNLSKDSDILVLLKKQNKFDKAIKSDMEELIKAALKDGDFITYELTKYCFKKQCSKIVRQSELIEKIDGSSTEELLKIVD